MLRYRTWMKMDIKWLMYRVVLVGGVVLLLKVYIVIHTLGENQTFQKSPISDKAIKTLHDISTTIYTTVSPQKRWTPDESTKVVQSHSNIITATTTALFGKLRMSDKATRISHATVITTTTDTVFPIKRLVTNKATELIYSNSYFHIPETTTGMSIGTTTMTAKGTATTTTPAKRTCTDAFKEVFEREKKFLCTDIRGGLGNFMFSFASVYGMASIANKTVIIQKNNPLIKYFRVKARIIDNFCICETAERRFEKRHCAFDKTLLNLTEHKNYHPMFYFQSWKYFKHVADDIRFQFKFSRKIRQKVTDIIKKSEDTFIRIGNVTSYPVLKIGVHVRRGDITNNPKFVKYGYLAAPAEYFRKAMAYFRQKYQIPLFLVCSDDMKWCKKNIVGNDVMYMEGNSLDVDLAILSHCNHSIISVGTFGWWSAFLAPGETIYYKHPVRNGSGLRKHFSDDYSDYFYPGWIGME